ncbi:MAG: hypothetical protein MRK00_15950 [Nitrosomonas sp.]|nr:hypothetical protein [Nitrosomonas sp.]
MIAETTEVGAFSKRRTTALKRYTQFGAQGIAQESIWRHLNRQVFPGDDQFVQKMQKKINGLSEDKNRPKAQRCPPAPNLKAIAAMYATGEYSYLQIAAFYNLHFTIVGKVARLAKEKNRKASFFLAFKVS